MEVGEEIVMPRGILEASGKRCLEDQKDFPTCGGGLRSGRSHCGMGLKEKGGRGRFIEVVVGAWGGVGSKLGMVLGILRGQAKGYGCFLRAKRVY